MRCDSSASLDTGPDKKAALNIWNVTPEEAMLTPRSSRTSPVSLPDASIRNDSRRLSAILEKSTESQYRTEKRGRRAETRLSRVCPDTARHQWLAALEGPAAGSSSASGFTRYCTISEIRRF